MEDASTSSPASTPGPIPGPVPSPAPFAFASTSAPGETPPQQQRRAVGIVGENDSAARDVGMNLNMLLVGVDDGFVTLEQNVGDDMAMGSPPGAPGKMDMGVGAGAGRGDESLRIPTLILMDKDTRTRRNLGRAVKRTWCSLCSC